MTSYFGRKGLGAEVLLYTSDGAADYLLTSRVRGEDCTDRRYLDEPRRLAALLGEGLRALHETDCSDCPIGDHTSLYLATAEKNRRLGLCDLSFAGSYGIETADEAWAVLKAGEGSLQNEVLLHGDYCLPNVMLDDFRFSGYIDVGNGGVGDRHVDLFWGAWTLAYNLGTDVYRDLFFEAYGRDRIDFDRLRTVAAAETFG
jgi:kanamycin kinase